jgi:hypothetical protein
LDLNYSINITIQNDSASDIVAFSFDDFDAQWNYHTYFFKAYFLAENKVYRNDYFDSQQNLKYYQIASDNSYAFNISNVEEYQLTFAPNKYSMMLAPPTFATKSNQNCDCFFADTCFLVTTCALTNQTQKVFTADPISIFNARVQWNNVLSNATIVLQNIQDSDNYVSNSSFVDAHISVQQGSSLLFSNVLFENTELTISDKSVVFHNVTFVNSTLLLDSATLDVRNSVLDVVISNFSNITYNATIIVEGTYVNSSVVYYNASDTLDTNMDSMQLYYNCSTISLIDDSGSALSLFGTDNYGDAFSSHRCYVLFNNTANVNVSYNYTFYFDTQFLYFENNPTFTSFNPQETIVFVPTHIPYWDYSTNTTWQTDFRNYTLLQNISALSDVRFSVAGLNITILGPYNYSGLNLSSLLFANASRFSIDASLVNASVDVRYTFPFERFVVIPDVPLSFDDGVLVGSVPSGVYDVYRNLTFLYDVPSIVYENVSFDIPITYGDYSLLLNATDSCVLLLDSTPSAFTNISISGNASVAYEINCVHPDLDSVNVSGVLDVMSYYISGFDSLVQYVPFTLVNNNPALGCDCNLSVTGDAVYAFSNASGLCSVSLTLPGTSYAGEVVCSDYSQQLSLNLLQGYSVWGRNEEFAGFTTPSVGSSSLLFIISEYEFISAFLLNSSLDYYSVLEGSKLFGKITAPNLLYYRGKLFNENIEKELLN